MISSSDFSAKNNFSRYNLQLHHPSSSSSSSFRHSWQVCPPCQCFKNLTPLYCRYQYTLLIVWHDGSWNLCRTHILVFLGLYSSLFFTNLPKFSPYFVAPFLVSFFLFVSSKFPLLLVLTWFFQFCCYKPSYVNRLYKLGFFWNSWDFFPFYVDIRWVKTFHKACWYSTR